MEPDHKDPNILQIMWSMLASFVGVQNKKNFELKRNIVKIWYAKFDNSFDKVESFIPYFKDNNAESESYVKEYCEQYAVNYFVSSQLVQLAGTDNR